MSDRQSKNRKKSNGVYLESHHILPRSMGGSDSKDNLVLLTAREHFIAHRLLCKIYPDNAKMKIALFLMCQDAKNTGLKIPSRLYENVRLDSVNARRTNAGHDDCIPFSIDVKIPRIVVNWTRHLELGNDNMVRTANALISNCLAAQQEAKYVSYSRNTHNPAYTYKRKFKISVHMIKKCLDILEAKGLVINEPGSGKDVLASRKVSRYKASQALLDRLSSKENGKTIEDKIIV